MKKEFRVVGKEYYTGNIIYSKWYEYNLTNLRKYRLWLSELAYNVEVEYREVK